MASLPKDPALEFHIRRVPGGAVSNFVGDKLQAGDDVRVEGPFGSSWLRDSHRGPILALAGGSGLAPIKSTVEQALASDMLQVIHLYFGVRDERDLYLEDHFERLAESHGTCGLRRYFPNLPPARPAARGFSTRQSGPISAIWTEPKRILQDRRQWWKLPRKL